MSLQEQIAEFNQIQESQRESLLKIIALAGLTHGVVLSDSSQFYPDPHTRLNLRERVAATLPVIVSAQEGD